MTEAKTLPTLVTGGAVRAIIPQDFEGAWRIALAISKAGMSPPGLETPEKVTIAILAGLEVGLPPMQAIQSIAIINNRPSIYGDGALALVRASGLLESLEEKTEGQNDSMTAFCRVRRRGEPTPIVRSFSVAEAKKAGLWTRKGPWEHYPARMLTMRARAFALRDGFADVLRGLGVAEEMADIKPSVKVPVPPPDSDEIPDFGHAVLQQAHSGNTVPGSSPVTGAGGGSESSPPPSTSAAGLKEDIIKEALLIATDDSLDEDDRIAALDSRSVVWEGRLPDTAFCQEVLTAAVKVVRKQLPEQKARLFLSTLIK